MNNLTNAELVRFNRIKNLVKSGAADQVGADDRQFVLDMLAKSELPVNPKVVENANKQGFKTAGVKVKA